MRPPRRVLLRSWLVLRSNRLSSHHTRTAQFVVALPPAPASGSLALVTYIWPFTLSFFVLDEVTARFAVLRRRRRKQERRKERKKDGKGQKERRKIISNIKRKGSNSISTFNSFLHLRVVLHSSCSVRWCGSPRSLGSGAAVLLFLWASTALSLAPWALLLLSLSPVGGAVSVLLLGLVLLSPFLLGWCLSLPSRLCFSLLRLRLWCVPSLKKQK